MPPPDKNPVKYSQSGQKSAATQSGGVNCVVLIPPRPQNCHKSFCNPRGNTVCRRLRIGF